MATLLHISDLHRSGDDSLSNQELLSGLLSDIDRWRTESGESPVSGIVVSGDLVQGLRADDTSYPDALQAQYGQAEELLVALTDQLLGGNRTQVAMVPGNHDVAWPTAMASMSLVDPMEPDIRSQLANPADGYRWCWRSRRLYRITDSARYIRRFDEYKEFVSRFYQDAAGMGIDPGRPWNFHQLLGGDLLLCGFNSCLYNDCFCGHGNIDPNAIASAYMSMRATGRRPRVCAAMWHHDLFGPPQRSDYMDADTVRLLIDKGFRLGFHGHQHRAEASPIWLHTSDSQTMGVISAGSLGAGSRDLPTGFNRQYNLVTIHEQFESATVYVREMAIRGVFGPGRLAALGGRSSATIKWTQAPPVPLPSATGGEVSRILDEVDTLMTSARFSEAADLLTRATILDTATKRPMLLDALFRASRWADLLRVLEGPHSASELTIGFRACEELRDWATCDRLIQAATRAGIAAPLVRELSTRLGILRGNA